MPDNPRNLGFVVPLLVVVLAVLTCYVGTYCVMVERMVTRFQPDPGEFDPLREAWPIRSRVVIPRYRIAGQVPVYFFAPVHLLDRYVRRDRWVCTSGELVDVAVQRILRSTNRGDRIAGR